MLALLGKGKAARYPVLVVMMGVLASFAACSAQPRGDVKVDTRDAEETLNRARNDPRLDGLNQNLKQARAVLIVAPGSSRGVAIARDPKKGTWAGPAFYQVVRLDAGGGAFGFRARDPDLSLVALAMTPKALSWLMQPTVPGKGGLTVASGLDRTSRTSGGAGNPDVLLYDLGGGHMPNLDGVLIAIDKAANSGYFGRPVTPDDILVERSVTSPVAAPLLEAAGK